MNNIFRGQIFWAELKNTVGSQQRGKRPVVIYSNNSNNKHSETVHVVPLTTSPSKKKLPTHVEIVGFGLYEGEVNTSLAECTTQIDKRYLREYIGTLDDITMTKTDDTVAIQFGLKIDNKRRLN
jgi:mRNA interferase MazF